MTVSVDNLQGGPACTDDVLDMYVYQAGVKVGSDATATGCPSISLNTTDASAVYLVDLRSFGTDITVYTITLQ